METLTITIFALLILFSIGFLVFFIYAYIYGLKLGYYLKEKNYDRWSELTTVLDSVPGWSNPSKSFAYIYGNLDNEDGIILKYKHNIKFGFRKCLFMIIAVFINVFIFGILMKFSNQ